MFHAQHFDECKDLCEFLQEHDVKYVPRVIGEEADSKPSFAHKYSPEQLDYMKNYWNNNTKKLNKEKEVSKDIKNETQILENKKIQKEAIENDVRFLKEDLYKDLEFFENSKKIYDKEIGKEASKSDGLKYEIEKNDSIKNSDEEDYKNLQFIIK